MPNMPDKPDTWAFALAWLSQHSPLLYAATLSCWIAFLRVIYGGGGRRQALLESCLCGAITAGAFPLLEYFNLPSSLAAALGACIGTLGVKKVASLADRFTNFKLPKQQE
ncbi:phage holin, lambda family [Pseudomonas sp. ODNR1LW]|nr:phage holin, lambda family [Pseudomonas sp. ODNR1LW]